MDLRISNDTKVSQGVKENNICDGVIGESSTNDNTMNEVGIPQWIRICDPIVDHVRHLIQSDFQIVWSGVSCNSSIVAETISPPFESSTEVSACCGCCCRCRCQSNSNSLDSNMSDMSNGNRRSLASNVSPGTKSTVRTPNDVCTTHIEQSMPFTNGNSKTLATTPPTTTERIKAASQSTIYKVRRKLLEFSTLDDLGMNENITSPSSSSTGPGIGWNFVTYTIKNKRQIHGVKFHVYRYEKAIKNPTYPSGTIVQLTSSRKRGKSINNNTMNTIMNGTSTIQCKNSAINNIDCNNGHRVAISNPIGRKCTIVQYIEAKNMYLVELLPFTEVSNEDDNNYEMDTSEGFVHHYKMPKQGNVADSTTLTKTTISASSPTPPTTQAKGISTTKNKNASPEKKKKQPKNLRSNLRLVEPKHILGPITIPNIAYIANATKGGDCDDDNSHNTHDFMNHRFHEWQLQPTQKSSERPLLQVWTFAALYTSQQQQQQSSQDEQTLARSVVCSFIERILRLADRTNLMINKEQLQYDQLYEPLSLHSFSSLKNDSTNYFNYYESYDSMKASGLHPLMSSDNLSNPNATTTPVLSCQDHFGPILQHQLRNYNCFTTWRTVLKDMYEDANYSMQHNINYVYNNDHECDENCSKINNEGKNHVTDKHDVLSTIMNTNSTSTFFSCSNKFTEQNVRVLAEIQQPNQSQQPTGHDSTHFTSAMTNDAIIPRISSTQRQQLTNCEQDDQRQENLGQDYPDSSKSSLKRESPVRFQRKKNCESSLHKTNDGPKDDYDEDDENKDELSSKVHSTNENHSYYHNEDNIYRNKAMQKNIYCHYSFVPYDDYYGSSAIRDHSKEVKSKLLIHSKSSTPITSLTKTTTTSTTVRSDYLDALHVEQQQHDEETITETTTLGSTTSSLKSPTITTNP